MRCSVLILASALIPAIALGASDDFVRKLDTDILKVEQAIRVTRDIMNQSMDARYQPSLHFRMAELHVEHSRYLRARAVEHSGATGDVASGARLEIRLSKQLAIEQYSRILELYPRFQRRAESRFFMAHEYRELGQHEEMIRELDVLIKDVPRSDWAAQARLTLGDHYADRDQTDLAEKYYRGIIRQPEGPVHDLALYRLGWIRINQRNFADALRFFERAVTSNGGLRGRAEAASSGMDVKRQALMAMVWPFSEVRPARRALKTFRELAPSKTVYVHVLRKLANRYVVKSEVESAALLYREVVRLSPRSGENIEYLQRIYESVSAMSKHNPQRYAHADGDVEAIVRNLARVQNDMGFTQEQRAQLNRDFEVRARDLSTRLHRRAQRTGDPRAADLAARAYEQYLSLFAAADSKRVIATNRASALYEANRHLDAGAQYEQIAMQLPVGLEQRAAVVSAIGAYHRALDDHLAAEQKGTVTAALLNRLALLRVRQGLKQLGAHYLQNWPTGQEAPAIRFHIASIVYQQGELYSAAALFERFVADHPSAPQLAAAVSLALDALNRLGDLAGLAATGERLAETLGADHPQYEETTRVAREARKRLALGELSRSDDPFGVAWLNSSDGPDSEALRLAAFRGLLEEKDYVRAYAIGARFVERFPKSESRHDVLLEVAKLAVRGADFASAADYFEQLARAAETGEAKRRWLTRAGNLRRDLGDVGAAAADYRALGGSRDALAELMPLLDRGADWEGLDAAASVALALDKNWSVALMAAGVANARRGNTAQAQRLLQRVTESTGPGELRSRAYVELARQFATALGEVGFASEADATATMGRALELAGAAEGFFTEAVRAGDARWGIAALYELAQLYGAMADLIGRAPVPPNLASSDVRTYRATLAQESATYRARATEVVAACRTRSQQLGLLTEHARACVLGNLDERVADMAASTAATRPEPSGEITERRVRLMENPESAELWTDLAAAVLVAGDAHQARMMLVEAMHHDPRSARILNLVGVAAWQAGAHQAAKDYFERAVKLESGAAVRNLAALLDNFGYLEAARDLPEFDASDVEPVELHPLARRPRS